MVTEKLLQNEKLADYGEWLQITFRHHTAYTYNGYGKPFVTIRYSG